MSSPKYVLEGEVAAEAVWVAASVGVGSAAGMAAVAVLKVVRAGAGSAVGGERAAAARAGAGSAVGERVAVCSAAARARARAGSAVGERVAVGSAAAAERLRPAKGRSLVHSASNQSATMATLATMRYR